KRGGDCYCASFCASTLARERRHFLLLKKQNSDLCLLPRCAERCASSYLLPFSRSSNRLDALPPATYHRPDRERTRGGRCCAGSTGRRCVGGPLEPGTSGCELGWCQRRPTSSPAAPLPPARLLSRPTAAALDSHQLLQ